LRQFLSFYFYLSFGTENIFGGQLLGVRSPSGLSFYDWETTELIRRIEITPKQVFWSENGELVAIACEDSFYVLRYQQGYLSNIYSIINILIALGELS